MPNVPDKVMDKAIKEQKIDLHQKVEEISIHIMAGGEPKIEIKGKPLDKDGSPKVGIDNPNNPFFVRDEKLFKIETNTDPWDSVIGSDDYIWNIGKEVGSGSFIGLPFTTSVKEGDYPPTSIPSSWYIQPSPPDFSTELGPLIPSVYRTIGMPKPPKNEQRTTIVPTSKPYKDMKCNDETEYYRRAGIKSYKARDGKNIIIVDRKSEIQFQ